MSFCRARYLFKKVIPAHKSLRILKYVNKGPEISTKCTKLTQTPNTQKGAYVSVCYIYMTLGVNLACFKRCYYDL